MKIFERATWVMFFIFWVTAALAAEENTALRVGDFVLFGQNLHRIEAISSSNNLVYSSPLDLRDIDTSRVKLVVENRRSPVRLVSYKQFLPVSLQYNGYMQGVQVFANGIGVVPAFFDSDGNLYEKLALKIYKHPRESYDRSLVNKKGLSIGDTILIDGNPHEVTSLEEGGRYKPVDNFTPSKIKAFWERNPRGSAKSDVSALNKGEWSFPVNNFKGLKAGDTILVGQTPQTVLFVADNGDVRYGSQRSLYLAPRLTYETTKSCINLAELAMRGAR